MKLTHSVFSALLAAANAALLPPRFTLVTPGGGQLLTDGQFAYQAQSPSLPAGQNILILSSSPIPNSNNSRVDYLAPNAATPTAFQTLFAFPEGAPQPLSLTIPHSGAIPKGADETLWSVHDDGNLAFAGSELFAKNPEGKIVSLNSGMGHRDWEAITLWVKEAK